MYVCMYVDELKEKWQVTTFNDQNISARITSSFFMEFFIEGSRKFATLGVG